MFHRYRRALAAPLSTKLKLVLSCSICPLPFESCCIVTVCDSSLCVLVLYRTDLTEGVVVVCFIGVFFCLFFCFCLFVGFLWLVVLGFFFLFVYLFGFGVVVLFVWFDFGGFVVVLFHFFFFRL